MFKTRLAGASSVPFNFEEGQWSDTNEERPFGVEATMAGELQEGREADFD